MKNARYAVFQWHLVPSGASLWSGRQEDETAVCSNEKTVTASLEKPFARARFISLCALLCHPHSPITEEKKVYFLQTLIKTCFLWAFVFNRKWPFHQNWCVFHYCCAAWLPLKDCTEADNCISTGLKISISAWLSTLGGNLSGLWWKLHKECLVSHALKTYSIWGSYYTAKLDRWFISCQSHCKVKVYPNVAALFLFTVWFYYRFISEFKSENRRELPLG